MHFVDGISLTALWLKLGWRVRKKFRTQLVLEFFSDLFRHDEIVFLTRVIFKVDVAHKFTIGVFSHRNRLDLAHSVKILDAIKLVAMLKRSERVRLLARS